MKMEGKRNKIKIDADLKKNEWEAPKLISLDKGKTEGGGPQSLTEDDSYTPGPAS